MPYRPGAGGKLDAASRQTAAWLRTWDRAPRPMRERMLHELIANHSGQTAPEIERKLGIGASLLFTRLVSWLRLSHSSGGGVSWQLRAIGLFVCAPAADRFRAEFVTVGGIQTVIDTVTLPAGALPDSAKGEALALLAGIARTSREHKTLICELRASGAAVAFMQSCHDDSALDCARKLLAILGSGNPAFVHEIHADVLELLSGVPNSRAQLYAAAALREILAEIGHHEFYAEGVAGALARSQKSARASSAAAAGKGRGGGGRDRAEGGSGDDGASDDGSDAGGDEQAQPQQQQQPQQQHGQGEGGEKGGDASASPAAPTRPSRHSQRQCGRKSVRQSIDADGDAQEALARSAAMGADCILGSEYVDVTVLLLHAFAVQTQREGSQMCSMLAEHASLHSLLCLRLKATLIDPRSMHAQAAAAQLTGQLLTVTQTGGAGSQLPVGDEFSSLAEHEESMSLEARTNRAAFAERLVQAEVVPLICLLLLRERSSECRRQAAVSLSEIARHASPAATSEVQRYASPVFEELLVRSSRARSPTDALACALGDRLRARVRACSPHASAAASAAPASPVSPAVLAAVLGARVGLRPALSRQCA
jgi:hypothetical protein